MRYLPSRLYLFIPRGRGVLPRILIYLVCLEYLLGERVVGSVRYGTVR